MPLFFQIIALLLLLLFPAASHAQESGLAGLWMTEDQDGVVEFQKCDEAYCGRFYWLREDSATNPSLDDKNNDPQLRKRPLCGMIFMGGFADKGEGRYDGGWIYSPRHGSTYSANLYLKDADTLELRGFIFIPLLGGTQTWSRVESAQACDLLNTK